MVESLWTKALWVFMVGFSGVFACLVILMGCVKALSLLPRLMKIDPSGERKGAKAHD